MGLRSKGPGTAYAGTKCSPGNAASSSAEAAPACCTLPVGSTATEPACCSSHAAGAAIKLACCTIPAGHAATQEDSRKGIVGSTYLRQSRSCSRPHHPRPWKATGQGMGHQRQISQSPWMRPRDDN